MDTPVTSVLLLLYGDNLRQCLTYTYLSFISMPDSQKVIWMKVLRWYGLMRKVLVTVRISLQVRSGECEVGIVKFGESVLKRQQWSHHAQVSSVASPWVFWISQVCLAPEFRSRPSRPNLGGEYHLKMKIALTLHVEGGGKRWAHELPIHAT